MYGASQFINLTTNKKAEYNRHVDLIDLQLDFSMRGGAVKNKKAKISKSLTNSDSSVSEKDRNLIVPPRNLRQIFQISNNNRKKNKQRKKSKLEMSSDMPEECNPSNPLPQNVN